MNPLAELRTRRTILENGLTVLTAPRHAAPIVSVWTCYAVGSRDELEEGSTGLAHFLEHMMFKGTPRHGKGEVDRLTQLHGGSNNAYTSCDLTCYYFDLPARHIDVALRIEADRMRNLSLDPQEFAAEQGVIIEEIRRSLDEPERRLLREADRMLFPDHPYGHPILGWLEDVEALTFERMRAFYECWYAAGNCVLVVAGDFDEEALLPRVAELFGGLDAGTPGARPERRAQPPADTRRKVLEEDVSVPRLYAQFLGIDASDEREPALDCLAQILAPNKTSRLHRRLVRDEGLVSSVTAENDSRAERGVVYVEAAGVPGADVERIEAALFEELDALATKGPEARELERAQRALRAAHIYRTEAPCDIAEDLGDAALVSSFAALAGYAGKLMAVEPIDVARACAELCARDRSVVTWSVPAR